MVNIACISMIVLHEFCHKVAVRFI